MLCLLYQHGSCKEELELLWVPHNSAAWWTLWICLLLPHLKSILGAMINKCASLGHQPSQSSGHPLLTLLISDLPPQSSSTNPGRTADLILLLSYFPTSFKLKTTQPPLVFLWALSIMPSWLLSSADLACSSPLALILWSSHHFYCLWPDNLLVTQTTLWFSDCSFLLLESPHPILCLQSTSGYISFLPL